MNSLDKRLAALEQSVQPAENVFFGSVLIDMVSYSMMPFAVALLVLGRRAEARELVEIASNERGLDLTDVQIDAAVRHIAKHLDSHRTSFAKSYRYWVSEQAARHGYWRQDAAHRARNNPSIDEEAEYARLVEFWRQRDGETSEEIIRRHDAEHEQGLRAIAERIATLRFVGW